jgi:hypothetical protein
VQDRVQRHVPVGDHDAPHAHLAQALERGRRLRVGPEPKRTHQRLDHGRERQVAPRLRERRAQRRGTAPAQYEQRGPVVALAVMDPVEGDLFEYRGLRLGLGQLEPRPLAQLRAQPRRGRLELHERSHGIEEDGPDHPRILSQCRADSE